MTAGWPLIWPNSPAGTDGRFSGLILRFSLSHFPGDPLPVTTSTLLCALLASGLAIALARENRLRRAFQDLVTRLLTTLRQQAGVSHPTHRPRRRV
jgi:hypothetical protein